MLLLILQVLQVVLGVLLIAMVLLHSPKGDGLGAIGSAAQIFSSQKGAEAGLNKITAWIAGLFFAVAIITGYFGDRLAGNTTIPRHLGEAPGQSAPL